MVHVICAKTRLDRHFSGRFGSESYAFEEFVAELVRLVRAPIWGCIPSPG
jgi:antirestriction protein ArdC